MTARTAPLKLGVLASGSGTNLQALLDACASGRLPAQVAVAISNLAGAHCLTRAQNVGVPSMLLEHKKFSSREAYDAALVDVLRLHGVELVCLAGFMRLVTPVLLDAFPDRVLNIHPSLLPSFPGLHAVKQALRAGVRVSGCTIHFVDGGTDTGPILLQAAVPVLDGDSEESLAARIHLQEHKSYIRAVELICHDAIEWGAGADGKRRARISVRARLPDESGLSLVWPPLSHTESEERA